MWPCPAVALAVGGPGLLASLTAAAGALLHRPGPLAAAAAPDHHAGRVGHGTHADRGRGPARGARTGSRSAGNSACLGRPLVALATLMAIVVLSLRAPGSWRIWSPLIAISAGCATAAAFGAYDVQRIHGAAWVGLPSMELPRLDLTPGADFWALLPAFVVVALVGGIKNIGDCIAIQHVSWRRPRVTDFRVVQGSLTPTVSASCSQAWPAHRRRASTRRPAHH